MNNKETLIKTLRGSVAQLNELSDMTEGIDVYDAAGYVDTEFLMEALSCVNTFMDASNMVITKISSLLLLPPRLLKGRARLMKVRNGMWKRY